MFRSRDLSPWPGLPVSIPGCTANGHLHPLIQEVSPVQSAVIASLENERIPILDTVVENAPLVGIIRPVEVSAITGRKESADPHVEMIIHVNLAGGVEHIDGVVCTVVLGVEHERDVFCDGSANIEADAVQVEGIGCFA